MSQQNTPPGIGPVEYFAIVSTPHTAIAPGFSRLKRFEEEEPPSFGSKGQQQLPPVSGGRSVSSGSHSRCQVENTGSVGTTSHGNSNPPSSIGSTIASQRQASVGGLVVTHRYPRSAISPEGLTFPERALCWNLHNILCTIGSPDNGSQNPTSNSTNPKFSTPTRPSTPMHLRFQPQTKPNVIPSNQSNNYTLNAFAFVDPNSFDLMYCSCLDYVPTEVSSPMSLDPTGTQTSCRAPLLPLGRNQPAGTATPSDPSAPSTPQGNSTGRKETSLAGRRILCIVSREPNLTFAASALESLYRIVQQVEASGSAVNGNIDLEIEEIIASLFDTQLRLQHGTQGGPTTTCQLQWKPSFAPELSFTLELRWSRIRNLPYLDAGMMVSLMSLVNTEKLVLLLEHLLAEQSLVVISPDSNVLTSVLLAILSLLFPFRWTGSFLPVLPRPLFGALSMDSQQPRTPYLYGIMSDNLHDIKMQVQSRLNVARVQSTSSATSNGSASVESMHRVTARMLAASSPHVKLDHATLNTSFTTPTRPHLFSTQECATPLSRHSNSAPTTPAGYTNEQVFFEDNNVGTGMSNVGHNERSNEVPQETNHGMMTNSSSVLILDLTTGSIDVVPYHSAKVSSTLQQNHPKMVDVLSTDPSSSGLPKRTNSEPSLAGMTITGTPFRYFTPTRLSDQDTYSESYREQLPPHIRKRLIQLLDSYNKERVRNESSEKQISKSITWALKCRIAFLEAFASILQGFRKYMVPLKPSKLVGGFDVDGFLQSNSVLAAGGLVPRMLHEGQMFREFVLDAFMERGMDLLVGTNSMMFEEVDDVWQRISQPAPAKGKRSPLETNVRRILDTLGYSTSSATKVVSKLLLLPKDDLTELFQSVDRFKEVLKELNISKDEYEEDHISLRSSTSMITFSSSGMEDKRTNRLIRVLLQPSASEPPPIVNRVPFCSPTSEMHMNSELPHATELPSVGSLMVSRRDRYYRGTCSALLGATCVTNTSFTLDRLTSVKALFRSGDPVEFLLSKRKPEGLDGSYPTQDGSGSDSMVRAVTWAYNHECVEQQRDCQTFVSSVSNLMSDLSSKVTVERKARKKAVAALARKEASLMELSFAAKQANGAQQQPNQSVQHDGNLQQQQVGNVQQVGSVQQQQQVGIVQQVGNSQQQQQPQGTSVQHVGNVQQQQHQGNSVQHVGSSQQHQGNSVQHVGNVQQQQHQGNSVQHVGNVQQQQQDMNFSQLSHHELLNLVQQLSIENNVLRKQAHGKLDPNSFQTPTVNRAVHPRNDSGKFVSTTESNYKNVDHTRQSVEESMLIRRTKSAVQMSIRPTLDGIKRTTSTASTPLGTSSKSGIHQTMSATRKKVEFTPREVRRSSPLYIDRVSSPAHLNQTENRGAKVTSPLPPTLVPTVGTVYTSKQTGQDSSQIVQSDTRPNYADHSTQSTAPLPRLASSPQIVGRKSFTEEPNANRRNSIPVPLAAHNPTKSHSHVATSGSQHVGVVRRSSNSPAYHDKSVGIALSNPRLKSSTSAHQLSNSGLTLHRIAKSSSDGAVPRPKHDEDELEAVIEV